MSQCSQRNRPRSRANKGNVTFVANQNVPLPNRTWFQFVRVSKGLDVADTYIAEHLNPEDLVVTQDVPLAAEVVVGPKPLSGVTGPKKT